MAEHIKSEYGVTGWPGLLPHPTQITATQYELRNGVFMYATETIEERRDERSPARIGRLSQRFDEVYLQLMRLDLYDEGAVLAWVNEFGVLEIHEKSRLGGRGEPAGPYRRLRHYPRFAEEFQPEVIEESDRARRDAGFDPQNPRDLYPATLGEFRWGAACICDLARAYWCLSTGADPGSLVWRNPAIDEWVQGITGSAWWLEWDDDQIEDFLLQTVSLGLEELHPVLIPRDVAQLRGRERSRSLAELVGPWPSDLYAICCLELFNHIAEGAVYKTCMNETCGRWFVRQQGRSDHDQRRRSGVRYCSYACARQQTQRNYRRRQRPPDGGDTDGISASDVRPLRSKRSRGQERC